MIRKIGSVSALAAGLILGVAGSASAGTLDQQQTDHDSSVGLYVGQNPAQTFTAGITGVLDQVDLHLCCKDGSPVEPLTVEIRNTSAGEPGTSVLASTSLPMSALANDPLDGEWVPVTFGTPAAVMAGTQYALVAYTAHPINDCCAWNTQTATNPYSGGQQFISLVPPPGEDWLASSTNDLEFKTYVGPAPPPPPSNPATTQPVTKKKCKKHKKHRAASAKKHCKKK